MASLQDFTLGALDEQIESKWGAQWTSGGFELPDVPPTLSEWVNRVGNAGHRDACRLIFVAHVLYDLEVLAFLRHHQLDSVLEPASSSSQSSPKTRDNWRKRLAALTFNLWLTQAVLTGSQVDSCIHKEITLRAVESYSVELALQRVGDTAALVKAVALTASPRKQYSLHQVGWMVVVAARDGWLTDTEWGLRNLLPTGKETLTSDGLRKRIAEALEAYVPPPTVSATTLTTFISSTAFADKELAAVIQQESAQDDLLEATVMQEEFEAEEISALIAGVETFDDNIWQ